MCGGSGGSKGGGGGSGGPDMATPVSQMTDEQLLAGIKTLPAEIAKTGIAIDAARTAHDNERRKMLRALSDKLETRFNEIAKEAGVNRGKLRNKLKYDRGYVVGVKE